LASHRKLHSFPTRRSSDLEQVLDTCQEATGITVERTVSDAIGDRFTQAASSGDTPDLIILDNPSVTQFAETGILADNEASGIDRSEEHTSELQSRENLVCR